MSIVRQNGMGMAVSPSKPLNGSINVRAVVINVYYADDENREERGGGAPSSRSITADVLTYGGPYRYFLPRVPLAPVEHGVNDYDIRTLRPSTKDLSTGEPPKLARDENGPAGDPTNFDGDHVIVKFLEDSPKQPFIAGVVPHPHSQYRPVRANGELRAKRFRGVVTSIDDLGNVTLDTTRANEGFIDGNGEETPADDASHGRITVLCARNASVSIQGVAPDGSATTFELSLVDGQFEVRLQDGASLSVSGKDNAAVATIGSGARSAAVAERLEALYAAVKTAIEAHTHPDGWGSTAPPVIVMPTWDALIASTKLKMPDS
jgi:hypothetical protein